MKIIKQSRITLNMFKSIGFVLFFPKGLEIISVHMNIQFRCARLRKRAACSHKTSFLDSSKVWHGMFHLKVKTRNKTSSGRKG